MQSWLDLGFNGMSFWINIHSCKIDWKISYKINYPNVPNSAHHFSLEFTSCLWMTLLFIHSVTQANSYELPLLPTSCQIPSPVEPSLQHFRNLHPLHFHYCSPVAKIYSKSIYIYFVIIPAGFNQSFCLPSVLIYSAQYYCLSLRTHTPVHFSTIYWAPIFQEEAENTNMNVILITVTYIIVPGTVLSALHVLAH